MDHDRQRQEIERNYDVFQRSLRAYLETQRDRFALMRGGQVLGFFDTPDHADMTGAARFADRIYSIQQVTDEPVQLGIYANAVS